MICLQYAFGEFFDDQVFSSYKKLILDVNKLFGILDKLTVSLMYRVLGL